MNNTTAFGLFCDDVQEFVGPLALRPQDLEVLSWLFNQPTSVYSFIKKNCPYRMPENWRNWYEFGMDIA